MATYTEINGQTVADILGAASDTQEQKWVLKVALEAHRTNPFKAFLGGYRSSKPIMEVIDTQKIKGQEIVLHNEAPLGHFGIVGDNLRVGNEEKTKFNNYKLKVGNRWNGEATTKFAKAQTVIGSDFDRSVQKKLADWLGWMQGWDIEVEMLVKAHSLNTVLPNGKTNRDDLGTVDVLLGETVTRARNRLLMNQAKPIITSKYKGGADQGKYVLVGTQFALEGWERSDFYKEIIGNASYRGDENAIFQGNWPDYEGTLIYKWDLGFGTQNGPIGCAGLPVARLGAAITAGTTAFDIKGGGSTDAAADTDAQYFAAFSNAPYLGFEGSKRAADTTTLRYLMIKHPTSGKFGFYAYKINNGNKITIEERLAAAASGAAKTKLTGSSIEWGVAPWTSGYLTDAFPVGSEIYEVNAKGVPIVRSYVMGDSALISGYGSFDGKIAAGVRTQEIQDHGRLIAVGMDTIWGCAAIPRTDGLINGYVVIESAYPVAGMPTIQ